MGHDGRSGARRAVAGRCEPDSVWRFEAGGSALDGATCAATVSGWMPRGELAASLSIAYGEGALTVSVEADEPVDGLVLAVYTNLRPTWRAVLRGVHPSTPETAVIGWDEPADGLVAALRAGDIAAVESASDPGERLPPIYAFSLKGSSVAAEQVLACRVRQNPSG